MYRKYGLDGRSTSTQAGYLKLPMFQILIFTCTCRHAPNFTKLSSHLIVEHTLLLTDISDDLVDFIGHFLQEPFGILETGVPYGAAL